MKDLSQFKLPTLKFKLPEWREENFVPYQQAVKKLAYIAKNGGQKSDRFKDLCLSFMGRRATFRPDFIKQGIDVRAFTYLLKLSDFVKVVPLTHTLLEHLLSIRNPLSKLSLTQLISAYFERYDELTSNVENLNYLCQLLKNQLEQHFAHKQHLGTSDLATFYQHRTILFAENAPEKVVEYAKQNNIDLAETFAKLGLRGQGNGRFCTNANYIYYLETLKTLPVGKLDPILNEICQEPVYTARYQTRLLGHKILEILIDRSTEHGELTQAWQDVIMQIAGDPRVPKSTDRFQRWWQLLGEKRIEQMQIWLNRFNLKLFLKILEQSAKEQENHDMERMFEPRKDFIIGLDNQNLIRNSRLLLTDAARRYVFQHYQRNKLPNFASVSGQTSIIYLQLTNGQHIIEGSHTFRIKLFDTLPDYLRILDYSKLNYDDTLFRGDRIESYARVAKTHDKYLNWLNDITKNLTGLKLDMSRILSRENYRYFLEKFGVYY